MPAFALTEVWVQWLIVGLAGVIAIIVYNSEPSPPSAETLAQRHRDAQNACVQDQMADGYFNVAWYN